MNNSEGFSFYHFFGMAGNARLVLVFMVLIVLLALGIDKFDLGSKLEKVNKTLNPITSIDDKFIYIKSVDEFVDYPPYGEIYVYDSFKGEDQRITFDEYYDASPTYSESLKTIFFESKRKGDVKYELMSGQSDLYGYNLKTKKVNNSRELVAFSLDYDDSDILSPVISSYNDSLIAFLEKRYLKQNLIVCNYITKEVIVKLPINPHTRSYVVSFLKDYVAIFDANRSSRYEFGTFFVSLVDQSIQQIPNKYRSKYYFTGKSKGNKYFAVSKVNKPKIGIYSYSLPSEGFTLIKEIDSSIFGNKINDIAVEFVLNNEKIIYYYSNWEGQNIYIYENESLNLLLSTKKEIVDFEFH